MQNSKIITMQTKLQEFESVRTQTRSDFKGFLKDTSICLEDRWALFVNFGQAILPYNYDPGMMLSDTHEILKEIKIFWGTDLAYDIVFENAFDCGYDLSDDEVEELQELILATGCCGEDF
jgi:hypothetical protein